MIRTIAEIEGALYRARHALSWTECQLRQSVIDQRILKGQIYNLRRRDGESWTAIAKSEECSVAYIRTCVWQSEHWAKHRPQHDLRDIDGTLLRSSPKRIYRSSENFQLKCPSCAKVFRNKQTLASHWTSKHQRKCCYCERTFNTPAELTRHKQTEHRPDAHYSTYSR